MKLKLLAWDAKVSDRLRIADKPGLLRNLAILFAHSGDSWFWLLGLGLILWRGSGVWKQLALWMLLGIAVTAALVFMLKLIVRRRRPPGEWGGIYRKTDPHSFPSGHAARAAMLAVLVAGFGPLWLGVLLVVWALLVILARVAMGVHYFSDVLAGMLLGIGVGVGLLILIPRLPTLV